MNRKRITTYLLFLILFSMPFIDYSCEKIPNPNYDPKAQYSSQYIYEDSFGYTVGFPLAFIKVHLDPLRIRNVYPPGLIDVALIFLVFYLYRFFKDKKIEISPTLNSGIVWISFYLIVHFLYNIYFPLRCAYIDTSDPLSSFASFLIFPYFKICERLEVDISNMLTAYVRINFVFTFLIYFLLGIFFGKMCEVVKNKIHKAA